MISYDGVSAPELAVRLSCRRCLVLREVGSTLDIVHTLALEGLPSGTLVLAEEQTAGRGRHGRSWLSRPGVGIWLGYLMRPRSDLPTGVLALRVGMAVAGAVRDLGAQPGLKWPNDVLLSGLKLAGILCEARSAPDGESWVAVGVGINVHGPLPADLNTRAVALDQVIPEVSRLAVLEHLMPRLHCMKQAPLLGSDEQVEYQQLDWLRGREVISPLRGQAIGVDQDGALVVETPEGRKRIVAGSVVTGGQSGELGRTGENTGEHGRAPTNSGQLG